MILELILEKKTEDLDIREILINIRFGNERSFSDIMTEIRAIQGVTVISIINPSTVVSGSDSDAKNKIYFASIKVKMEVNGLDSSNYVKILNQAIKKIHGIKSVQMKRKILPRVNPQQAQEIKNLLTI